MVKGPEVMNAMLLQSATRTSNCNTYSPSVSRRPSSHYSHRVVVQRGVAGSALQDAVLKGVARSLQLTRRGRLVLLGIPALATAAVLMFASMALVFGSIAGPAHAAASYKGVDMADYARTVTVLQGESLWSIAAASNPHRNIREVVREIVVLNELGTGVLQAGQQLFVPIPQ